MPWKPSIVDQDGHTIDGINVVGAKTGSLIQLLQLLKVKSIQCRSVSHGLIDREKDDSQEDGEEGKDAEVWCWRHNRQVPKREADTNRKDPWPSLDLACDDPSDNGDHPYGEGNPNDAGGEGTERTFDDSVLEVQGASLVAVASVWLESAFAPKRRGFSCPLSKRPMFSRCFQNT